MTRTFKEVGFKIDVEEVTAETLDRVIERQNVYSFAVFDIETLVDVDEIPEFDSEVVSRDLVHLDLAFFNSVVTQANKDSIPPLLATIIHTCWSNGTKILT